MPPTLVHPGTASSSNLPAVRPEHPGERIAIAVGGISFAMWSREVRLGLDPGLVPFSAPLGPCDIEAEVLWAEELALPTAPAEFASGGLWSAYRENGGTALYFRTAYLGQSPYKKAWFAAGLRRCRVQLLKRYFSPELPVYPLEYPLDELLMMHCLSETAAGAEIHACGVSGRHGGTLFVGHSGAGKSTTSRLWRRCGGDSLVLSDDRIILRREPGGFRMYGTPWHGDAGIAEQASSSLDRIYILEHGPANEITPLPHGAATAELFTRTFVPHYDRSAIDRTLRFLESVSAEVPVSRFRFVPDPSAVEAIVRAA